MCFSGWPGKVVSGMSIAYVFALVTGFVLAGFISSLWPLVARREVSFGLLYPAGMLLPLEIFVVVISVPLLLLKIGVGQFVAGQFRSLGVMALVGALLTGFLQGVALLSLVY